MTGFALKMIALVSMIIDHIGAILIPNSSISEFYTYFRLIGRIAFPVYAFLIAEGCRTTRSMPKYLGRLALFAVISEPFYRMALSLEGMSFKLGNVFPTLALGAAAVYIFELLKSKRLAWLSIPSFLLLMAAAWYCETDYGGFGVILIFLLYLLPEIKDQAAVLIMWSAAVYLGWLAWDGSTLVWLRNPSSAVYYIMMWICASVSAVIVYFYNGERGRKVKWAFYIAYPVHLLILSALRELLELS